MSAFISEDQTSPPSPESSKFQAVETLIDRERYPIADLAAPAGRRLADECQRRFADKGLCLLPGFATESTVDEMSAEAQAALDRTYFCHNTHNAYLKDDDPSFPAGHPRRRRLRTDVGSIAYDDLIPNGALCRLYRWEALTRFIGAVLGYDTLYRAADPLGALSVNVFEPGGGHAWHFDEAHFTVTLMLQAAQQGGFFEYVPGLRTPQDDNYPAVGQVLDGAHDGVQRMPFTPGTLAIFNGRYTLHRVTTVGGLQHRLVAVLCYDTRPGSMNSEEVRRLFWGRTSPRARP